MPTGEPEHMTSKHFEILKESGILNTDVTLHQLIEAGSKLSALNPGGSRATPTLVGDWYVYHQLPDSVGSRVNPAEKHG